MPTIKPISDLRNYNELLKEVDTKGTVYLTRNGVGSYAIMTVREADEYQRLKALHGLLSDLERSRKRADQEGWLSEKDLDEVMGL